MKPSPNGWVPDSALPNLLRASPDLQQLDFELHALEPLIDSAEMNIAHWQAITHALHQHFDANRHDGVIILHGTDTLAHTAAMMSFCSATFPAPIILTGAMRSLHCKDKAAPSDGWANLVSAFDAIKQHSQGVYIAFAGEILHAARATKFDGSSDHAFRAPNGNKPFQVTPAYQPLTSSALQPLRVAQYICSPYSAPEDFTAIQATNPDVLLLTVYGSGTVPDLPDFFAQLQQAHQQGLLTVALTQCPIGQLEIGQYAASSAVAQTGCLSAGDMTRESVLAKLFYLHQLPISLSEKKQRFEANLIGER